MHFIILRLKHLEPILLRFDVILNIHYPFFILVPDLILFFESHISILQLKILYGFVICLDFGAQVFSLFDDLLELLDCLNLVRVVL